MLAQTPLDPILPPASATASLCVLASGSSGNCSVLAVHTCGQRRLYLIDAGLSPRRTAQRLAALGLSCEDVDGIFLTHLDSDHWCRGWIRRLPTGARIHVHSRHARAAAHCGMGARLHPIASSSEICPGMSVTPALGSHDAHGVAVFRFDFGACGSSLGFATDLGRVTGPLIDHFRNVDVLAIESNYCPRLQHASPRPWVLKRRIMGGAGHLSNDQACRAIDEIGPRVHVVLLHLSRECNDPSLVASLHDAAPYGVTITSQFEPSPWVPIAAPHGLRAPRAHVQIPLFASAPEPVGIFR